jgi:outer membrane protein
MYAKFILINLLIFFSVFVTSAQVPPVRVISLQECLKLAIDNSPRLKINALEQNKLHYRYKETVGTGLPHINFTGSFDDYVSLPTQLIPGEFFGKPGELIPVQFGTTYNLAGALDASQIIYNQTYLVGMRMARLALEQNHLESERVRTEVVFEVAQSYYTAQITLKQVRNLQDNLKKLEKAEQIARSQYENGLIRKVDLDRIVVNELNTQTAIDRLQVMYEQQLNMQRYFMGLDLDQPIIFSDTVVAAGIDLSVMNDLSGHIDIRMLEKQKQLASANIKMDQSQYYPSLNLIASMNYLNQSNTYYFFGKSTDWFNTSLVGLRFSVPVFSGLQKRNRVNQSKIELDQLHVTEDNTLRVLRVTSKDAANHLNNAIKDEERQRENMRLAERVYSISQEQYQKGVISLTDLLNAETGLSDSQTNHSLALVQMKIAELEYLKANGRLLSIMNN